VRFVARVSFKDLRVELAFSISRYLEILESARRCCQIARIAAVAGAFALGATLAPGRSNELVELFTHHRFKYDPHSALSQRTQVLMEDLLVW